MAIKTYELCKEYKDVKAVDRLSLEISENEIFALLGVNGAGKTTTVKMLSCLTRPTSGDAEVMGYSVTKEPEKVKSVIDISMQETAIGRNLTVMENLKFYAGIRGLDGSAAKARIDAMTEAFGFEKVLKKRGKTLSGGWQRKLSIAMALLSEPKVLFLDEPTLGLDVLARHELWDMIRNLRGGTTIVLTTHYMEEAEQLSDRIGIMKEGRLIAVGTAESFIRTTGCQNFEDAFIATVTEGGSK
ncbi:MAG: ABC transporter ATP-binding protein [Clostridia bacterium]|nr:ABC transporter ATP-binding protein [Clostridia bacterium]